MPTNKLRRHARELLSLAIKAHDDGHIGDARSLTSRAAEFLESNDTLQCPLFTGGFNRSTQHLLILLEEEVCDGGDCTDMVHVAAEG